MEQPFAPEPAPLPRAIALTGDLQRAIEQALVAAPAARWRREAQALSERYRAPREGGEASLATGPEQALGYAALIMPATFAQLRGAMAATAARAPHWRPATMLDLGSGPGTALWAAAAQWPSLEAFVAAEREPALIALGRRLAAQSASAAVSAARWERQDLRDLPAAPRQRYDLVVIGHVLNELDAAGRALVIERAWALAAGVLLIVEPGTTAAFAVVRAARDQLLGAGSHTLAPCAHDAPCPLAGDWCHFPQRLIRPEFQRRAREAPNAWEDTKYSYAAMARFAPDEPVWGRVIAQPTSNKAYAEALISERAGVRRYRGLKRHRDAYRAMRDLAWGDALREPPPAPVEPVEERHAQSQI
jgi:ribosomal protein RSM22 (predicted rRNA methylase)